MRSLSNQKQEGRLRGIALSGHWLRGLDLNQRSRFSGIMSPQCLQDVEIAKRPVL